MFHFLLLILLMNHIYQSTNPSSDTIPALRLEVVRSRVTNDCDLVVHGTSGCREILHIEAISGQRRLELVSDTGARRSVSYNLLPLGTYNARLIKDEHKKPYFSHQEYELEYADGAVERFELEGESSVEAGAASQRP